MVNKERNYCLDLFKGIACIFVVFMHCEFPGKMGTLVQCISRFCVPFFFMVSGYFCYNPNGTVKYSKKIIHVLILIIGASLFYLIVTPLWSNVDYIPKEAVIDWIVFNTPWYIAGQLWFVFALFYDYILFCVFDKLGLRKLAYILIPVLMIIYICLAQGAHLAGIKVPNEYYRNFLIEGFLFFSLGAFLHEYKDRFNEISNRLLMALIILSTMACPLERMFMNRDFGVNIVTFVQVIAMFVFAVNNPSLGKNSLMTRFGADYSMFVYIIHPSVWHLLAKYYSINHLQSNMAAMYLMPVFCVIITVLVSTVPILIKKSYRTIKKKRSAQS